MKYIMGVDPGLSGALAILDPGSPARVMKIIDVPTHEVKKKRQIDLYTLASQIDSWAKEIRFAVIEDVHAMPDQGVVSMFTFGQSKGIVMGMLATYMIPMYFIKPEVWKGVLNLSRDKDRSREMATKLFPTSQDLFLRKKDADRAEALLIAVFGAKHLKDIHGQ